MTKATAMSATVESGMLGFGRDGREDITIGGAVGLALGRLATPVTGPLGVRTTMRA